MEHELSEKTGGEGYTSWIQPICSCGWVGIKVEAYNNYQWTEVRRQGGDHLKRARLEKREHHENR